MSSEKIISQIYQEKKFFTLGQLKDKKISYYNKQKKHIGFYEMGTLVPKYRRIKERAIHDDKLAFKIKKDIKRISCKNELLSNNPLTKYSYKANMLRELEKIKKYHKIATSSDFIDTENSTMSLFELTIQEGINEQNNKLFKNFLMLKENVKEGIKSKNIASRLLESQFTKKFFQLNWSNFSDLIIIPIKEVLEYKLLVKDILKFLTLYAKDDLFVLNNARSMSHSFLEFMYFSHTRELTNTCYVTRYFTGQGEHQSLFTNAMRRMIWFMRLIDKKTEFNLEDMFLFMEIYIPNYQTLIDITDNMHMYIEYHKLICQHSDIMNSLRAVLYKIYLEISIEEGFEIEANTIQEIVTRKIATFLEDEII